MTVFQKKYSKIYDLVYQDKDSESEINLLEKILKEYDVKKILDIGCGTGRHSMILAKKGYDILGIDKSIDMVKVARTKIKLDNLRFKHCSILKFKKQEIFDACLSLFDVIGYLKKKDIPKFFKIVSEHLQKNGLFIFDYWDTKKTEQHGISKILFKFFKTEKKRLLRMTYSEFKSPKVKITWKFISLPDFNSFKEIHEKETFSFKFLNKVALFNNFVLLKSISLSDINSLLIFQKQ